MQSSRGRLVLVSLYARKGTKGAKGGTQIFCWNKKKALALLRVQGLQLPKLTEMPNAFIHNIIDDGLFIKKRSQALHKTAEATKRASAVGTIMLTASGGLWPVQTPALPWRSGTHRPLQWLRRRPLCSSSPGCCWRHTGRGRRRRLPRG